MTSPQLRRRARERALQFLYGLDFTHHEDPESLLEAFWRDNPSRPGARAYAETLIRGVLARQADLDGAITATLDRWTPDRVGRIEQNILRIALYEMRFTDDVPERVAINEAVEVAKRFGSDAAPRFINGVLDRLKAST